MKIRSILLLGIFVLGLWYWYDNQPITYGHGKIATETPKQVIVSKKMFVFKEFNIQPLASFDITARVLSKERYWLDSEAKLAPVDLALGWGPMSDEKVLDELNISQSGRWFRWNCKRFPIPQKEIENNSGNMHLIPSNDEIESKIKRTKKGNLVKFKGYLVRITGEKGWIWQSSLTRTDTGNGACEVVYVEEYEIVPEDKVELLLEKSH